MSLSCKATVEKVSGAVANVKYGICIADFASFHIII